MPTPIYGISRWRARQRAKPGVEVGPKTARRRNLGELGKHDRLSGDGVGQLRPMPVVWQSPRSSPRSGKPATWRRGAVRWVWNGANYAGEGMYAPDDDGGKLMFPALVYPI